MEEEINTQQKTEKNSYTVGDAVKVADDILNLGKDKKYNLGAFIHGLIFALEYAQISYKIPQQQINNIQRDCRKYFKNIDEANKNKP